MKPLRIPSRSGALILSVALVTGVGFFFAERAEAARNDKRYLRMAAGSYRGQLKRIKATWINNPPYTTKPIPTARAVFRVPPKNKTTKWTLQQNNWDVLLGWPGKAPTYGIFGNPALVQNGNKVLYKGRVGFDLNLGVPPKNFFLGSLRRMSAVNRGRGYVLQANLSTTKGGADASGSDYLIRGKIYGRK